MILIIILFHQIYHRFEVAITWKTRPVKTLFPLKDKSIHPSCGIYKGTCSCGESYIGKTIRNASIRWEEPNVPTNKSEPTKHLKTIFIMYLTG